jgi:GT2 family glycosyltransferase
MMPAAAAPRVSVLIVSLNGRERLAMPLGALRACDPAPWEVIVVDNGSTDGTSDFVRAEFPEARLVRSPRNLGFAGGNNLAMMNARGEILILLNDDTVPDAGFLAPLLEAFAADARLGAAGVRLVYPDGRTLQHLGGFVEANGLTKHVAYGEADDAASAPRVIDVEYATGACLALRREAVRATGLLDEGFWPIYFEEVD